jgi:hypothetical protein
MIIICYLYYFSNSQTMFNVHHPFMVFKYLLVPYLWIQYILALLKIT